jgi:DNA invertase Pin-like site-specific DNA recombinase
MRAIAYVRVSTEEQKREGYGPAAQRASLNLFAASKGFTLVDVIEDLDVSAGKPLTDRPGGARLFAELSKPAKTRKADAVIVTSIDRMFRDTCEGLQFLAWASPRKVRLISVLMEIDTSSATGKLNVTMMLAHAEFERNRIRERTREAMAEMKRQGRLVGSVPFGCVSHDIRDHTGAVVERYLKRDPATWPTRQRIVDLYRNGLPDGRDVGYELLARYIALHTDLRTAGGKRWFSKATLKSMHDTHDRLSELPLADEVATPAATQA